MARGQHLEIEQSGCVFLTRKHLGGNPEHEGGLPWWFSGKESACQLGDVGSVPGSGRCPGEGNGSPLQYSYLENSMDRGAWWALVHGVAKNRKRLSNTHSRQYSCLGNPMDRGAWRATIHGVTKSWDTT